MTPTTALAVVCACVVLCACQAKPPASPLHTFDATCNGVTVAFHAHSLSSNDDADETQLAYVHQYVPNGFGGWDETSSVVARFAPGCTLVKRTTTDAAGTR